MRKSIAARFGMTQSPKPLSRWIAGPGCFGLTDHARLRTGYEFRNYDKADDAAARSGQVAAAVRAPATRHARATQHNGGPG
jgi:hypothetical protein